MGLLCLKKVYMYIRREQKLRLFQQLHQNDDVILYRSSGSVICPMCGLTYREHIRDEEHPGYEYSMDIRLCNGEVVHL